MSEQWRFQWPDGTWIRWNPQTQSWEKETAEADASPAPQGAAPSAVQPPVEVVKADEPVVEEPVLERSVDGPAVEEPALDESIAHAAPVDLERALGAVPRVEEPELQVEVAGPRAEEAESRIEDPVETFPSRRERRTGRADSAGRSMIGDVLPPQPEPDRPGGSLWPTVITGMVVGLAVGLLIWSLIR
jgi:hypothetical protein